MSSSSQQGPDEARATAFIGDLSASRDLDRDRRREVQERLTGLLEQLSDDLHTDLLSRFTVTLGDEFQGLLSRPSSIPEILWRLRRELPSMRLWIGVGFGGLDTRLQERAIGMDGPAFHNARRGVERAREDGIHGGVFAGFGSDDVVLTGLSRLLDHHRRSFTAAQLDAAARVRSGSKQSDVAAELQVTPQAISKRLKAADWEVYRTGEEALQTLLGRYDTADEWDL